MNGRVNKCQNCSFDSICFVPSEERHNKINPLNLCLKDKDTVERMKKINDLLKDQSAQFLEEEDIKRLKAEFDEFGIKIKMTYNDDDILQEIGMLIPDDSYTADLWNLATGFFTSSQVEEFNELVQGFCQKHNILLDGYQLFPTALAGSKTQARGSIVMDLKKLREAEQIRDNLQQIVNESDSGNV